jgi:hypothetical protein
MDPDRIKIIPIKNPKAKDGADDRADSQMMRPYTKAAEAIISRHGLKEAVEEIAQLPLEQRYIWRILSALEWGFADFDSVNVVMDRKTLSLDDGKRVAELLVHRPVQFCAFLKALLGDEAMEEMMTRAVSVVKKIPPVS